MELRIVVQRDPCDSRCHPKVEHRSATISSLRRRHSFLGTPPPGVIATVTVRRDELGRRVMGITLPRGVREALHVDEGDDIAFVVEGGQVTMQGLKSIPADQAWFWRDDWQAGERETSGQLARGEGAVFEDGAAFLDSLA